MFSLSTSAALLQFAVPVISDISIQRISETREGHARLTDESSLPRSREARRRRSAEQFSKILSDLAEDGYSIDEMQFKSDAQLLSEYAIQGTEGAFAEIVARHTSLVYSAALRQVNSPTLAAEVTQGVFINLARNAANLSR